jgi:aminoglycoside phosphotransferase (APT) family kinase protein
MRMHDDEVDTDEDLARRLIAEQFPRWRHARVRQIKTDGTANAIFKIGEVIAARFPLRFADPDAISAELAREADAMRELAACLPFPTPAPIAVGNPGLGYPLPWSVQTWLPGTVAMPEGSAHSDQLAHDLALLIRSLVPLTREAAHSQGPAVAGI